MILIKDFKKVDSLEEAWQLNQKKSNRIVGGMLWLKMSRRNVQTAIDLSGLGLDTILETEKEFQIGAMTSLRSLECHEGLDTYTRGAMKESLRHIVGVQFRNLATVGGSIYGRYGFSDVLTMFMAMDSYVELYKGGIVPLVEYASRPYDRDILVRIIVKKENAAFYYQSVRKTKTDFPVLACGAAKLEDGSFRFTVGARPAKAVTFQVNEKEIAGKNPEAVATFIEAYVAERITTGSNLRGSAEYRKHLTKVLVKRAVIALNDTE